MFASPTSILAVLGDAVPELLPPPEPAPSAVERIRDLATTRPPQAFLAVAGLAGAALAVAVFAGSFRTTAPPEISLPQATAAAPGDEPAQRVVATEVVVHVAGAVVRPGVYRLRGSDRVADAIDEAGGPTPEADVHELNLAASLADGDRVYVPRVGEALPVATGGDGSPATPININRATAAELEALPGVGAVTAKAIVAYREEHGPFHSVDQLLEVRGIGPGRLEAVRDQVRV